MKKADKDLVWLQGVIRTPPFSKEARIEAGVLLRRLQQGQKLALPHSRPIPSIGPGCHELRVQDRDVTWRIFHYVDADAIVLLEITDKKTRKTPQRVLDNLQGEIGPVQGRPVVRDPLTHEEQTWTLRRRSVSKQRDGRWVLGGTSSGSRLRKRNSSR